MQLLVARAAIVLVAKAGKHLLPNAFAVAKRVKVARMQGPIEKQQLPNLPQQSEQCRNQKPEQWLPV